MNRVEGSSRAGCVPAKVKICWEMGGDAEEFHSLDSFLEATVLKRIVEFLPWVPGRLRVSKCSAPRFIKRDQDPGGEYITQELKVGS